MKTGKPTYDELLKVLKDLVKRCDGEEGVLADGSNIDTAWASSVLQRAEPDPECDCTPGMSYGERQLSCTREFATDQDMVDHLYGRDNG